MASKVAVLKLDGDFEQGFSVILQLGDEGASPSLEFPGRLPANSEIPFQYRLWQSVYPSRSGQQQRLGAQARQVKNISMEDIDKAAKVFKNSLNAWLKSELFLPIRERLLEQLARREEVRVIVQSKDIDLRRLPWHFWEVLERYPKAEVAMSYPAYERVEKVAYSRSKVRILAILGNSDRINIEADRQFLQKLPDAETVFLVKPSRQEFDRQLWDEKGWDILFFAGHSKTDGEVGRIDINDNDSIEIGHLKYALKKAIGQGLHLAIFNSCDGLGLAPEQVDLQVPQIIVMREPVPDLVAQEFLKNFLQAFSSGKSLYTSVREAREKLHGLENEFPCATWLPVICQNPAVKPLTWQELLGKTDKRIPTSIDGKWECLYTLNGHTDTIWTVAISPDGEIIASGSEDKTIKLWNLSTGKLLRTITGHTTGLYWLAFSPDGKNLASASDFSPIKIWDWQTGELIKSLKDDFVIPWTSSCGAFSPDGKILASGYNDTTIKLWDWQTGNLISTLRGHGAVVEAISFSPVYLKETGQTLVSCSRDNTVKIWDLLTGKEVYNLNGIPGLVGAALEFTMTYIQTFNDFSKVIYGLRTLAISPEGKIIASGGREEQIRLWRTDTGELLGSLTGHTDSVICLAFNPRHSLLASGSYDKTIKIWNWRSGEILQTLQLHSNKVRSVAFSPDGQTLVSGSWDRTIKIWRQLS